MKEFDWEKAKKICEEHRGCHVEAGMDEDWYWTSAEIFDGEKFTGGYPWEVSDWATPVCRVVRDDGSMVTIPCFKVADETLIRELLFGCDEE